MFVFVLFLLFDVASASRCLERHGIGLLDCVNLNLTVPPRPLRPKPWVRWLDLKINKIQTVNVTILLQGFPNLTLVDLRENPFDCVFSGQIRILSDCKSTTAHSSRFTKPSTTTSTTWSTRRDTSMRITSTISRRSFSEKSSTGTIILITLVVLGVLTCSVGLLCVSRWYRRRRAIQAATRGREELELMTPYDSSSSSYDSEDTIFEKTVNESSV